jgi:hypothetical protein
VGLESLGLAVWVAPRSPPHRTRGAVRPSMIFEKTEKTWMIDVSQQQVQYRLSFAAHLSVDFSFRAS